VIALLDHTETLGSLNTDMSAIHPTSSAHVWNPGNINPDLDPSEFRGIEAFLSTASLLEAEGDQLITLMRPAGGVPMGCRDVQKIAIADLLRTREEPDDYELFGPMLDYLESQLTTQPMLVQ
jgi:hypothetical protein